MKIPLCFVNIGLVSQLKLCIRCYIFKFWCSASKLVVFYWQLSWCQCHDRVACSFCLTVKISILAMKRFSQTSSENWHWSSIDKRIGAAVKSCQKHPHHLKFAVKFIFNYSRKTKKTIPRIPTERKEEGYRNYNGRSGYLLIRSFKYFAARFIGGNTTRWVFDIILRYLLQLPILQFLVKQ